MVKMTATLRKDAENEYTVILHDDDGNEIGSLVLARVPKGVRVSGWSGDDMHEWDNVVHHAKGI